MRETATKKIQPTPLGELVGDERETQACRAGHHAACVADQGQRIAPEAAQERNDGKGERERDRKAQNARLRLFRRVQPMAVAASVARKLRVRLGLLKNVVEMLLFGHDERCR